MEDFPFEKFLEAPFLTFVLVLIIGWRFHQDISNRLRAISELTIAGKTKIKLGYKEVDAKELGDALTSALQALEARVEELEATQSTSSRPHDVEATEASADTIPEEMREFLRPRVDDMLNSPVWQARYIDTLAKNTSVSEDLMHVYLRSRKDVAVFNDGGRPAAMLRRRSRNKDVS